MLRCHELRDPDPGELFASCNARASCPPSDDTIAPHVHELHSIDERISMKKEKTNTVQSNSI